MNKKEMRKKNTITKMKNTQGEIKSRQNEAQD